MGSSQIGDRPPLAPGSNEIGGWVLLTGNSEIGDEWFLSLGSLETGGKPTLTPGSCSAWIPRAGQRRLHSGHCYDGSAVCIVSLCGRRSQDEVGGFNEQWRLLVARVGARTS